MARSLAAPARPRRCRRRASAAAARGVAPSPPRKMRSRALRALRVAGDHDGELVAADPEDVLVRAHGAQEDARQRGEHLVAPAWPFVSLTALNSSTSSSTRESCSCSSMVSRCSSNARRFGRPVSASRRASANVSASFRSCASEAAARSAVAETRSLSSRRLNVGRHGDEQHTEGVPVGDERGRDGIRARGAEPVELGQLVGIGALEPELGEGTANDSGSRWK